MPETNTQVCLKARPDGIPQAEHFEIVEAPVPDLREGQFLVRNDYLSVDPAMRGWVSAVANYSTAGRHRRGHALLRGGRGDRLAPPGLSPWATR